jgi:hypothetical protein
MERDGCYGARKITLLDPILRQKGTGFRTNILNVLLISQCETRPVHLILFELITLINT